MRKIALVGSKNISSRSLLSSLTAKYDVDLLPLDAAAARYIDTVWPAALFVRAGTPAGLDAVGIGRLCSASSEGGLTVYVLFDAPAPEVSQRLSAAGVRVFSAPEDSEGSVILALEEALRATLDDLAPLDSMLIVDDDVIELRRLRSILTDYFRVTVVCSAIDALKYLEKHTPDLILLDYSMPVFSGTTFISLLKSQECYENIPVFFLTGKGESSSATVLECARSGASGCILKSATTAEMLTSLSAFRRASRERRRL